MTYRPLDFSFEIPHLSDAPVATPVRDMGQEFIAVALDLTENMLGGTYRIALTPEEARELHDSLGRALRGMVR